MINADNKNGHNGFPLDCERCSKSVRPPCPHCGHSLSAEIVQPENKTNCEVCGNTVYLPVKRTWADVLKRGRDA